MARASICGLQMIVLHESNITWCKQDNAATIWERYVTVYHNMAIFIV